MSRNDFFLILFKLDKDIFEDLLSAIYTFIFILSKLHFFYRFD